MMMKDTNEGEKNSGAKRLNSHDSPPQNPYPANMENTVLLIMPADGRWDLI
jgi:hypothetical protein